MARPHNGTKAIAKRESVMKKGNGSARGDVVLVTGFPAFTARSIARKTVESDANAQVQLLVREKFREAAEEFVGALSPQRRKRVSILIGDVCDMDFGLASDEFRKVTAEA